MKKNRKLQEILSDYRPELGDSDEYMANLQRKLEAVEAAKQLYETERRRNRSRMAVAFASGGVTGLVAAVYFLLHPIDIANPTAQPPLKLFGWLTEHSSMVTQTLLVAAFSVCAAVVMTQIYCIVKKDYTM